MISSYSKDPEWLALLSSPWVIVTDRALYRVGEFIIHTLDLLLHHPPPPGMQVTGVHQTPKEQSREGYLQFPRSDKVTKLHEWLGRNFMRISQDSGEENTLRVKNWRSFLKGRGEVNG